MSSMEQLQIEPSVQAEMQRRALYSKKTREMLKKWPNRDQHPRWSLDLALAEITKINNLLSARSRSRP
jgi:hypothetical protein